MASLDDLCKREMSTDSRRSLDDADKKNVSDAASAGLETRVIRSYDDVGLHGGKDDCEFCKSRDGEWSYQDAISHGVFQRHPGCECEIDYKTEKGKWQRQTAWENNTWRDVQDSQTLKMRQKYGANDDNLSAKERISRTPRIENVTAEYLKDATPGKGSLVKEPGYNDKKHEEENAFAKWLHDNLGGDIIQNKDSKTSGKHYADFWWRENLWELKSISSSKYNTFDQHVRDANKQIALQRGGFFIDISKGQLSIDDAAEIIVRSMKNRNIQQTDVLIKKQDEYIVFRIG